MSRWLKVLVAALLGLAVAFGAALMYVDGRYGPPERGSFSGPVSARGLVLGQDGSGYRLASTPGATATFIAALDNRGSRAMEVTSFEAPSAVSDVRWSVYQFAGGGSISGADTPWRSLPATVPARGTIRLLLTVRRPACPARSRGGHSLVYDGSLKVHWKSLLRTHTSSVSVLLDPMTIC